MPDPAIDLHALATSAELVMVEPTVVQIYETQSEEAPASSPAHKPPPRAPRPVTIPPPASPSPAAARAQVGFWVLLRQIALPCLIGISAAGLSQSTALISRHTHIHTLPIPGHMAGSRLPRVCPGIGLAVLAGCGCGQPRLSP